MVLCVTSVPSIHYRCRKEFPPDEHTGTLHLPGRHVGVLIGALAPALTVRAQSVAVFAPGAVVALRGTPHLWIADEQGVLHWAGDTRALAGKHVVWSNRTEVTLAQLQEFNAAIRWLVRPGLLKDGDPIYLVKWESEWPQPELLHIQSIADVELFGINGSNYGNFVLDVATWEQRYGISAAGLQRSTLPVATGRIDRYSGSNWGGVSSFSLGWLRDHGFRPWPVQARTRAGLDEFNLDLDNR